MAVITMDQRRLPRSPGGQGSAIALRDRSREFRRAKRHSVYVRILKVVLPLCAAGLLSLYVVPAFLTMSVDNGRGKATVKSIAIEAGALKMLDPRVKGVNANQDAYEFVADSATQEAKNADVMYLDKIRGKVVSPDGRITTLTAPNGVHNNKTDEITFNNGAVVNREPGMVAEFKTATANMKKQTVVSNTPVTVRLHESTIKADSMTLNWGDQRAIFAGNVRTHLERQPATPANNSQGAEIGDAEGSDKLPGAGKN